MTEQVTDGTRYILPTPQLPSYLTVYIVVGGFPTYTTLSGRTYENRDEGELIYGEVHSTIHVDRVTKMPHTWSRAYTTQYANRWTADILTWVVQRYGLKLQEPRYE